MSKSPSKRSRDDSGDWKHLLSVGGLLGAIALVLLLGALLRSDDQRGLEVRGAAPPALSPATAAVVSERQPAARDATPPRRSDRDPLPARVATDLQRLGTEAWTRQLAAVCEPDNVRRWLVDHGSSDELYILPVTIADRACFRVCWGRWANERAAERARLPAAVTARAGGAGRVVAAAEIAP